ncbi:MAG TPA: TonB family protein [Terriglobales bacterium]|nr:TonB family protein [Terriglobales bacterium]
MTDLPHSASPSETVEFDAFLRQIAESAQALSGAHGCAIAIRDGANQPGEEIFCVARSGDTAPPLGSRLDANSGISGECVLTGQVLHCDDTATDHRVDPEVCRELGLRSIVVLPVRGPRRTAGILEVFSTRPHAFTGEHIDSLKRLTEMIEMACASNSGESAAVALPALPVAATDRSSGASGTSQAESAPRIWANIHFPFPLSFLKNRRDYWIAGGGLAMLLLFALIGIKAFHASTNVEATKPVAQSKVKPSAPESAEIEFQNTPASSRKVHRPTSEDEHHRLQTAAKVELLPRIAGSISHDSKPGTEPPPAMPDSNIDSEQAPALSLASNANTPQDLLTPSTTLPALSPAVSQGVSGGILEHRVDPVYPREALARKLEGEVILEATITKTGQVRDLKVLKGSPILGRAALEAVKQWRYQPYRLNDQPLESKTQITVRFRAP